MLEQGPDEPRDRPHGSEPQRVRVTHAREEHERALHDLLASTGTQKAPTRGACEDSEDFLENSLRLWLSSVCGTIRFFEPRQMSRHDMTPEFIYLRQMSRGNVATLTSRAMPHGSYSWVWCARTVKFIGDSVSTPVVNEC